MGPFSYLGASIDAALNAYVLAYVRNVAAALVVPVSIAISISIVLRGYALLRGTRPLLLIDLSFELVWQGGLLALALSSALYIANVVATANGTASALMQMFSPGAASGAAALDQLEAQGAAISARYIALGVSAFPWGGWLDCLTGLEMAAAMAVLLLAVGGLLLLAKVALALTLAIGPLFVAAGAFRPTRHLFQNWINKLFNYALLSGFMTAEVALIVQIYGAYLTHLNGVSDGTNPVADCFDLTVLSGALLILAAQTPRLAAALTSGSAIAATTFWLVLRSQERSATSSRPHAGFPPTPPKDSP